MELEILVSLLLLATLVLLLLNFEHRVNNNVCMPTAQDGFALALVLACIGNLRAIGIEFAKAVLRAGASRDLQVLDVLTLCFFLQPLAGVLCLLLCRTYGQLVSARHGYTDGAKQLPAEYQTIAALINWAGLGWCWAATVVEYFVLGAGIFERLCALGQRQPWVELVFLVANQVMFALALRKIWCYTEALRRVAEASGAGSYEKTRVLRIKNMRPIIGAPFPLHAQ